MFYLWSKSVEHSEPELQSGFDNIRHNPLWTNHLFGTSTVRPLRGATSLLSGFVLKCLAAVVVAVPKAQTQMLPSQ
jgi:hypothetical protein